MNEKTPVEILENIEMLFSAQEINIAALSESIREFKALIGIESENKALMAAIFTGLLSGVFYYVTTKGGPLPAVLSGIGANVLENTFFAFISIKFLERLIRDNQSVRGKLYAFAVFLAAASLYTPQIIISASNHKNGIPLEVANIISTLLAGGAMNAAAAESLFHLFSTKLPNLFRHQIPYYVRNYQGTLTAEEQECSIILTNLACAEERFRFAPFTRPFFDSESKGLNLSAIIRAAQSVTPQFENNRTFLWFLSTSLELVLKLMVIALMLYGSVASYGCDTAATLQHYISTSCAAWSGIGLLSGQIILSIVGGAAVVSTLWELFVNFIKYRRLSTDLTLGGTLGTALTMASPFIGGIIASDSGLTATNLHDTCRKTALASLNFPGSSQIVNRSTDAFNGIFDTKSFRWLFLYALTHHGKTPNTLWDLYFLYQLEQLRALRAELQAASPEAFTARLSTLTSTEQTQLVSPALFARTLNIQGDTQGERAPLITGLTA